MKISLKDCLRSVIDNRGVTPHKRGTEWQDSGIPVISANNVKTSGFQKIDEIRYVPENIFGLWMKEPLEIGDIILTSEAPAGEVIYWDKPDKIILGQRLYGLKVKPEISSLYLKYYIQSPIGQKTILSQQSGSTVFGISAATFKNIIIDLPVRAYQDFAASILYSIDKLITNNCAIIEQLESISKDIYDYWFVQFDFPDENGRPYKSSGGKMVWNEELKRKIPDGWNVKAINQLVTTARGVSYSTEGIIGDSGVPMINLASFNVNSSYKPSGLKKYSGNYSEDDVLHPLDLIMCNTQQTDLDPKKDIIGKMMLVPDIFDDDIVSSHHITHLISEDISMRVFLNETGKTTWFHKAMSGFCSGTSILGLDVKHAFEYKLAIPEPNIRKLFSDMIVSFEKEKSNLIRENYELSSLRDFLLPMLMNGQIKIRTENDKND